MDEVGLPRYTQSVLRQVLLLFVLALSGLAQTNAPVSTNAAAVHAERVRAECYAGRRFIAGRVLQVLPQGLVVESGYARLLSPPLNRSWVVPGNVSLDRDSNPLEERHPDALCLGTVFLTNVPKSPAVKERDYVVIRGYPAGVYMYSPAPGVQKAVRKFSANLDEAVKAKLENRH